VNHLFIRFIRVIRGLILFRRERGDDFFEARIAAEPVPDRRELEFSVGDAGRDLGRDGELFEGQIFFPDPGVDQGEVSDIKRPVHRVFGDRKQLAGAFALSNGVRFVAQTCVDRSRQVRIPAGPAPSSQQLPGRR
jgi:hypothetical protein